MAIRNLLPMLRLNLHAGPKFQCGTAHLQEYQRAVCRSPLIAAGGVTGLNLSVLDSPDKR